MFLYKDDEKLNSVEFISNLENIFNLKRLLSFLVDDIWNIISWIFFWLGYMKLALLMVQRMPFQAKN